MKLCLELCLQSCRFLLPWPRQTFKPAPMWLCPSCHGIMSYPLAPNFITFHHAQSYCIKSNDMALYLLSQWAAIGECTSNPSYMISNCPLTCHRCQSKTCHDDPTADCTARVGRGECRSEPELMFKQCRWGCKWCAMDTGELCRRERGQRPALSSAGQLEAMFLRATESPDFFRYTPRVLSRSPWVATFETFLSEKEVDRILEHGATGWTRSKAGDGVQPVRTSSTSWCRPNTCQSDPVLMELRQRISNLTLVPQENAEYLQVLRYEEGQFYKVHHDQNSPLTSVWGPRMYTFFMYLSDLPTGGGETHFPRLNISVVPKRGRALLWPSVLDSDPGARDDRTEHAALEVSAGGVKYAANYWLHMYDFQGPNERGCQNTEVFGNW